MIRRLLAAAVLTLAVVACEDGQDPGLTPQERPAGTSDTLGACPPGGPDATTPPAGCLGDDGTVRRR